MLEPWILKGERIGLRAPSRDEFVARWPLYNDPVMAMVAMLPTMTPFSAGSFSMPPFMREQREAIWEHIAARQSFGLDVWRLDEDRCIGEALIEGIQWPHGSAEFALMIFDPADRAHGFGTEACRLAIAYGFDGLGLHRMYIRFLDVNPGVTGAVERSAAEFGARSAGVEREAVWAFGRRCDVRVMDVLRHEFPPHPATAALRGEGLNEPPAATTTGAASVGSP
jgi:RimJ/RimL family protein N-acetyltransferase